MSIGWKKWHHISAGCRAGLSWSIARTDDDTCLICLDSIIGRRRMTNGPLSTDAHILHAIPSKQKWREKGHTQFVYSQQGSCSPFSSSSWESPPTLRCRPCPSFSPAAIVAGEEMDWVTGLLCT
jgi:hypothetical protein